MMLRNVRRIGDKLFDPIDNLDDRKLKGPGSVIYIRIPVGCANSLKQLARQLGFVQLFSFGPPLL